MLIALFMAKNKFLGRPKQSLEPIHFFKKIKKITSKVDPPPSVWVLAHV